MKCQLIQTTKLADTNLAEKEMLGFLKNLSESNFLYREFKLTPAYLEQTKGLEEQRPDFVVVSPWLGLVSIEVKDWNLSLNQYEWVDQYKVRKTDRNGKEDWVDNPVEQASRYLYGFMQLLKSQGSDVFVSSLVAFPRLSRAEFGNKISNIGLLKNPQSKFYLDMDKTIFKEDLDKHALNPEKLLIEILKKSGRNFNYPLKEIEKANRILLPSSFVVGDFSKRQAGQQQLRIISEKQREWVFGIDRKMNYLLDVPGSGKTNALISRAIHYVDLNPGKSALITTYSENLTVNIRRIFEQKTLEMGVKYTNSLIVQSVPDLIEVVLTEIFSKTEIKDRKTDKDSFETWAVTNAREILSAQPDKFRVFDAIFIDEIQDFDNFYLITINHFLKENNYFFVGDIGQKIYERQFDLERLGIIAHRIELPKSYQMYRTPRHIAKLAVDFIWKDPYCRNEFEENGYKGDFQYSNTKQWAAEILKSSDAAAEIAARVELFLTAGYIPDDILIITSSRLIDTICDHLKQKNIPYITGEPKTDGFVALVEFQDAKGLEREIVLITGAEDLYDKSKPEGMFWNESQKIKRQGMSRRMIYVAITRTIEQLLILYEQPSNPFITDLLKLNESILSKRG